MPTSYCPIFPELTGWRGTEPTGIAGTKWVDSKEGRVFRIFGGKKHCYYNQDHMTPKSFYDTLLENRAVDYVADNAIPDGFEVFLRSTDYANIGYGLDFLSAQLSGVLLRRRADQLARTGSQRRHPDRLRHFGIRQSHSCFPGADVALGAGSLPLPDWRPGDDHPSGFHRAPEVQRGSRNNGLGQQYLHPGWPRSRHPG